MLHFDTFFEALVLCDRELCLLGVLSSSHRTAREGMVRIDFISNEVVVGAEAPDANVKRSLSTRKLFSSLS